MQEVKVFKYIESLDAFVVTDEYKRMADALGLSEWNPVVWIGRLFTLDNDYGEHWFDNWDLREQKEADAKKMGIDTYDLMLINPSRLKNGDDGPCNSDAIRKMFWRDVLSSFEISYELIFEKARIENERMKTVLPEDYIEDLEERIAKIQAEIDNRN